MSVRRSQRCKSDFDYKVFHQHGVKVPVFRDSAKMGDEDHLKEKKLEELIICSDLEYIFDNNSVNDMDLVELEDTLEEISRVAKDYRHIHVELKSIMDADYAAVYKVEYETRLDKAKVFIRDVKAELKKKKSSDVSQESEKLRSSLRIEEEFFRERLEAEILKFGMTEIIEIQENCSKFERLLEEYYRVVSRVKIGFDDDFEAEFGSKVNDTIASICDKIDAGRIKIRTLQAEIQKSAEEEKSRKEEEAQAAFLSEQKFQADAILTEIKNRCSTLTKKCDITTLRTLSDHQIFELQKNLNLLDCEAREILAKVTAFSQIASTCGDDKDQMLVEPKKCREEALGARDKFAMEVHAILTERDITEVKLKSSSGLNIDLGKFQGYESKTDIYSFKSEFEKLIQPTMQKRYWADKLKKNYLAGPALVLVDKIDNIDEIWKKLIEAYGNVKLLLQTKMNDLDKLGDLDLVEGDEKLSNALSKLINVMTELSTLAEKHKLEYKLYVGGGLEKIFRVVGDTRERRFYAKYWESSSSSGTGQSEVLVEKTTWENLKLFLQRELSIQEKLTLNRKSKECLGLKPAKQDKKKVPPVILNVNPAETTFPCHICGKTDHVLSTNQNGKKQVDYFSCPDFAGKTPEERRLELQKKGFCFQCLSPGIKHRTQHNCFKKYACPDESHRNHPKSFHVLVCEGHKTSQRNIDLLEQYKTNIIAKRSDRFKDFTKNISLHCQFTTLNVNHTVTPQGNSTILPDVKDSTIFMLQTINVRGHNFRLLYDSGGTRTVCKKSAIDKLLSLGMAKLEVPGPIALSGVGDVKSTCDHGIFSFNLPLRDNYMATFTGMCLDKVTSTFHTYHLGEVEKEIRTLCQAQGGDELVDSLPRLPEEVGGDTDFLIGLTYKKYHPKEVWQSPDGLFLSDSRFLSEDGTTGVVGGPHEEFTKIENAAASAGAGADAGTNNVTSFTCLQFTQTVQCMRNEALNNLHSRVVSGGDLKDSDDDCSEDELDGSTQLCQIEGSAYVARKPPKCVKEFEELENAGTEVSYRCSNCRTCQDCKKSLRIDVVSIQEEIESEIIEQCVTVDIEKGESVSKLPFVASPEARLRPNDKMALKVYESQVRNLNRKPEDKESALLFEAKLQDLGFVDYVHNLTSEQQDRILNASSRYVIPWRGVWNENSVSTPFRMVFDASQSTFDGCSLNSLLAKGVNNMNSMIAILIRWVVHRNVYHTDVAKMYNRVLLDEVHWQYQLYYWDEQLRPGVKPVMKVIKTLIYGVKPSGQLAEVALRKTAELTKIECPLAYPVINHDMYVDDCASGNATVKLRNMTTDQVMISLAKGGFTLKGITYSGEDPPENLTQDGVSVTVCGLKWWSKDDKLGLNISDLNFGKKSRGRKSPDEIGKIPEKLTKKLCAGKVAEVYDPLGWVTPVTAGFKIDINQLTLRGLDWDDQIPDEFRQMWVSNFEMIQELKDIRYNRAVVPEDAVNTDVETLCFGDASQVMICVGVYVRFRRKSGGYSCQLLFGRSKVVPKDMTIPRAELLASCINAATYHVVKTSLGDVHKKNLMFTDSQVALHWITCGKTKLKLWARNRVIEINRLVEIFLWRYVDTKDNPADVGTRKVAGLLSVQPGGIWPNGKEWMLREESEFPTKTVSQVVLDNEARNEAQKEKILVDVLQDQYFIGHVHVPEQQVPAEVGLRYQYCNYLVDPNRFRFRMSVRVLGLVFLFLCKVFKRKKRTPKFLFGKNQDFNVPAIFTHQENKFLVTSGQDSKGLKCKQGLVVELPEVMVKEALAYFFRKCTLEIKHFLPEQKYVNISKEIDGILYYSGRILPDQKVEKDLTLADVSFDLADKTFCVPVVDKLSPVAYALASEVHWYDFDVRHGGIESMLRQVQCIAFLIGGRKLVKDVKRSCIRCRILRKKRLEVVMGPRPDGNLCIAPAFHSTQVDICGPFDSFSNANKRATVKIWFVVFCCTATGAVDVKLMDDYSTDAFILAFIRFSCRYGYPCSLLPDPGSQLIKGCKDMILSFSDMKHKLSVEYGVSFETCPVGAHYVHGKVERKIQTIKKSIEKGISNNRLSLIQWETLGQQVANSINNLPLGIGSKSEDLENLDILTPNRLLLGRNNSRGPTAPLVLTRDVKKIVETNSDIFNTWFKSWLTSYVPTLMDSPKWFKNDRNMAEGDVVLFSKSEKEFEDVYQYGIVTTVFFSKDGRIRKVEVEYMNHTESVKRTTVRGVRDLIVIHPVEELGLSKELYDLRNSNP